MSSLGYKHTEDARERISRSLIGNKRTLGKKLSEEHRKKISEGNLRAYENGRLGYWKGKKKGPLSEALKKKLRLAHLGTKAHNWRGDLVSYRALHTWVRRHKPKPTGCEECGTTSKRLEVANISKRYLRDVNDFEWLCRSCHHKKDGTIQNIRRRMS